MTGKDERAPVPACLNCQTPLAGRFCHQCGQEGRSSLYSLRQLVAEVVHEVLDLEGKVVRSLGQLLFRPGRMTLEYIEGKRVRYVSPLRIYLLASVVSVAAHAVLGDEGMAAVPRQTAAQASDGAEAPSPALAPGLKVSVKDDTMSKAAFKRAAQWFPTAFMVLPPVLGLVMMGVYRRRKLPYSAHLYLALHLQALAYLVVTTDLLLRWPVYLSFGQMGVRISRALAAILIAVHIVLATRRTYRLRWPTVIVRTPVVMFVYLVVTMVVVFATVRLAGLFAR
jgi:hypothetical protein